MATVQLKYSIHIMIFIMFALSSSCLHAKKASDSIHNDDTSLLYMPSLDNNISFTLNSYIDKIFSKVDLTKGIEQYHFENILIFVNLYSSQYDKNVSKKFNDFLYSNFQILGNTLSKNLKKSKKRLNTLQFLYLYSQNMKNNLVHNHFLRKKDLIQYKEEYLYLLNDILLPFWYTYPAWHWAKQFPNMEARLIAKINKNDTDMLKHKYYSVFIDEDGFSCAVAADLLYIYKTFKNKLSLKINGDKIASLKNIRDKCSKYIKQKTVLKNNNFSFGAGDWSDSPSYAYAGCYGEKYPINTCIDNTIEQDVSHSSRLPWWIRSMMVSYDVHSSDYLYYGKWLKTFSTHFYKNILVKKENIFLLNNYINGKNGWYRVKQHPKYKNFGYGPYELSLKAALGDYYTLAEYNIEICNYIAASSILFSSKKNKYKSFYDEKYKTTYSDFLDEIDIYVNRFNYYYLLSKMGSHMFCRHNKKF